MAKQKLEFLIGANAQQFRAALRAIKRDVGAAARDVAAIGVGIGIASVKRAVDFQKAMAEVNTIARVTPGRLAELSSEVLALGSELGETAGALTGGLYQALSKGIPEGNAIDFLRIATKTAIAGVTDTQTSVDGLTSVMNAFGVKATDTETVADAMFATVRLGGTTFKELAANVGKVAPIASSAGVSFQEMLAALASMTKVGMKTEMASTSLRGVISELIKPNAELSKTITGMGFANSAAMLSSLGFQGALAALGDSVGNTSNGMAKLFPNVEGLNGALSLTGRGAAVAATDMAGVTKSAGEMNSAFGIMSVTGAQAFDRLKATIDQSLISIGTQLIPQMDQFSGMLRQMASDPQAVHGLAEAFQGVGEAIIGATALLQKFIETMNIPANWLSDFMVGNFGPEKRLTESATTPEQIQAMKNLKTSGILNPVTQQDPMAVQSLILGELQRIYALEEARLPPGERIAKTIMTGPI